MPTVHLPALTIAAAAVLAAPTSAGAAPPSVVEVHHTVWRMHVPDTVRAFCTVPYRDPSSGLIAVTVAAVATRLPASTQVVCVVTDGVDDVVLDTSQAAPVAGTAETGWLYGGSLRLCVRAVAVYRTHTVATGERCEPI